MPEQITTSTRRYPAAILSSAQWQKIASSLQTLRINWSDDKQTFTISASRDEYKIAQPTLAYLKGLL